jgi:hypothetical protein
MRLKLADDGNYEFRIITNKWSRLKHVICNPKIPVVCGP